MNSHLKIALVGISLGMCGLVVTLMTRRQHPEHPTSFVPSLVTVTPKYDGEDLSQATLDKVWPKLDHLNTYSKVTRADLEAARYKLKCLHDWVDTLQEGQVKESYLTWVNFYRESYDAAEKNNDKDLDSEFNKREAERRAKQARADALVIPTPPHAMCLDTEKTK